MMLADSSQTRIQEGWWSVITRLLVAVELDSWCADPAAFWTGEGLGRGWLGGYSLPALPVSALCGTMTLCLELTTGLSHWWVPTVLVWDLLLSWLMVDSRLSKLSLRLFLVTLSWSTMIAPPFLELTEEGCFQHPYVCHPCDVTSSVQSVHPFDC